MKYLRANGYKTYIVTGGGQDFVRVYAEQVYGIPPEQVVGTAGGTKYGYDKDGKPFLTKEPKLLLNDNNAGKPEGIHLMIGRRPHAAFGNSTGDQQMLEYTKAGDGARLAMLRAARRREARIRLRPGAGPARHQGRRLPPGALRRSEEERLDRHQHEERLEADLSPSRSGPGCSSGAGPEERLRRTRRTKGEHPSNPVNLPAPPGGLPLAAADLGARTDAFRRGAPGDVRSSARRASRSLELRRRWGSAFPCRCAESDR